VHQPRLQLVLPGGGTVLASPFSGATYLYANYGLPVVPRAALYDSTADSRLAIAHLGRLRSDPAVCAALERLGVRYVYVDRAQAWVPPDGSYAIEPPAGSTLIDRGGTAFVYALPSCSPAA
jgi:hypothetical protein